VLAAVVASAIVAAPALAHHCGAYGTHAGDGGCLKKIKSKGSAPRAGQATGKRQHHPLRTRMYYDQ
jgi:hypothetical protein